MKRHEMHLAAEAGEFCTERSHGELPRLRTHIRKIIEDGDSIVIHRDGVKMLTTSFIDELLSATALDLSFEIVRASVFFLPELEDLYWEQVTRGVRLRK